MRTIFYSQDDDADRKKFETSLTPEDYDLVAVGIAEEIWRDAPYTNDADEWPITIALYATVDGPRIATFDIAMEYKPSFSATMVSEVAVESKMPKTIDRRQLIVHFFQVGILTRYQAAVDAGVWNDEDIAYLGRARWERVWERAEKNNKLEALGEALEKYTPSLPGA